MAKPGPKGHTAESNLHRGNPGKRKAKVAAAPIEALAPLSADPPSFVAAGKARAIWRREAPRLNLLNHLRGTDERIFGVFCDTLATYEQARDDLKTGGLTMLVPMTNGGEMRRINPAYSVMRHARLDLIRMVEVVCASPMSRMEMLGKIGAGGGAVPTGDQDEQSGEMNFDEPGTPGDPAQHDVTKFH